MNGALFLSAALPAFIASLVESVEALTIILAVGLTRGWRPALAGTTAGLAALVAVVLALGPALAHVRVTALQLLLGVLVLLFGMRWLRKAVLRAAGVIPLHDERLAFEHQRTALSTGDDAPRFDRVGFAVAFQGVLLEGLEVVFVVLALGATTRALVPAAVGAAAATALVTGAGAALHRPLTRIPENFLKLCVGVMLSAFGTFWCGEALSVAWPGRDWSLLAVIAAYAFAAAAGIAWSRALQPRTLPV